MIFWWDIYNTSIHWPPLEVMVTVSEADEPPRTRSALGSGLWTVLSARQPPKRSFHPRSSSSSIPNRGIQDRDSQPIRLDQTRSRAQHHQTDHNEVGRYICLQTFHPCKSHFYIKISIPDRPDRPGRESYEQHKTPSKKLQSFFFGGGRCDVRRKLKHGSVIDTIVGIETINSRRIDKRLTWVPGRGSPILIDTRTECVYVFLGFWRINRFEKWIEGDQSRRE